jgi:TatD DNase family protein
MEEKQKLDVGYADAHCHLNLFAEPMKIIEKSLENGVELIVTAGGSRKDNIEIQSIVGKNVFGVVGIDPEHIEDHEGIQELKGFVEGNKNIIGIGEIGLDIKAAKSEEHYEKEKELFEKQLEIAEELDVPIVIHSRGALDDVLEMLKDFKLRAMFHFFEGDENDVEKIKNYIISIPPVETSKRRRALQRIGLESIVLETDSPIVGKDPIDVKKSASIVAKVKGLSIEEVASATNENLRKFFYI